MKFIYTLGLSIFLILPQPSSAGSIKLDRIVAISDSSVLKGKSGNNYILANIHSLDINTQNHQQILHALADKLLGKEVRIEIPNNSTDRYARLHVNIYDDNNNWINGQLVNQGLAILSGEQSDPDTLKKLRTFEKNAERNNIGYWGTGDFKTYAATPYKGPLFKFIIVEGTVLQAKKIKRRIYLNFEEDWHKDFSIAIEKSFWKDFSNADINLEALAGKKIRVRGWVRKYNGPYLDIHDPGQLEKL